jgi:hypothetical protein
MARHSAGCNNHSVRCPGLRGNPVPIAIVMGLPDCPASHFRPRPTFWNTVCQNHFILQLLKKFVLIWNTQKLWPLRVYRDYLNW